MDNLHRVEITDIIFPGDLITSGASGKVYRVIRQMSNVNYLAVDEQGNQWKVRVSGAKKAPEGTVFNDAPQKELPKLVLGSTVRFTGPQAKKFPGYYVMIKHLRDDAAQFVLIGGNGDRYLRMPLEYVQPVKLGLNEIGE